MIGEIYNYFENQKVYRKEPKKRGSLRDLSHFLTLIVMFGRWENFLMNTEENERVFLTAMCLGFLLNSIDLT